MSTLLWWVKGLGRGRCPSPWLRSCASKVAYHPPSTTLHVGAMRPTYALTFFVCMNVPNATKWSESTRWSKKGERPAVRAERVSRFASTRNRQQVRRDWQTADSLRIEIDLFFSKRAVVTYLAVTSFFVCIYILCLYVFCIYFRNLQFFLVEKLSKVF